MSDGSTGTEEDEAGNGVGMLGCVVQRDDGSKGVANDDGFARIALLLRRFLERCKEIV